MKAYEEHMTYCPKCHSDSVRGPFYESWVTMPERMRWTCENCHYTEYTACKDAEKRGEGT